MNLPLPPELLAAVESVPGAGAAELGCSDASLYRRFRDAGLQTVMRRPQLGADRADESPERVRLFSGRIMQGLTPDAAIEFRASIRQAVDDGTMLWAEPYHRVVATKPA